MKVICISEGFKMPEADGRDYVKEGKIYTVKKEVSQYSELAKRTIEAYEFVELWGYFDKSMFIPLSDIDEMDIYKGRKK